MNILIVLGCWIVFSVLCGFFEGNYYSKVRRKEKKRLANDHIFFTAVRGAVAVMLLWAFFEVEWQTLILGASMVVMFPFFHDGMLYLRGRQLDGVYPGGWFGNTTTSDAVWNFGHQMRIFMIIGSIILIITYLGIINIY